MDLGGITGLVLAGGRGSRMGGLDKGLQEFQGQPLALHALNRLQAQLGPDAPMLISANRHLASYERFGAPVLTDKPGDEPTDFAGPLAGVLAGLRRCTTPWMLTVPCDTPRFPADLARRLITAALNNQADIAMAASAASAVDGPRAQPAFCLIRAALLPSLQAFTERGERKVRAWAAQHRLVVVPFDLPGDDPTAFANANTLAELAALEER